MKYLSIKDAAALTGKSESSVKRFVNQVKIKEPAKYRDPARFKFEKLPNGNSKILISEVYLMARFTSSKNELHDLDSDLADSSERIDNTNSSRDSKNDPYDLVEFLKAQLIEKDKQIEALLENQRDYLERQKESNVLLLGNKQMLQLEEKPKRWWQRK